MAPMNQILSELTAASWASWAAFCDPETIFYHLSCKYFERRIKEGRLNCFCRPSGENFILMTFFQLMANLENFTNLDKGMESIHTGN